MNGNANLNANNLTPQNVEDWRNKLGIFQEIERIFNNPAVGSSFPSATFTPTQDLKKYKLFVLIFARQTNNSVKYEITNFNINNTFINFNAVGIWGYYFYQRQIEINITNNKIIFGPCYKQTSFGGGSQDNSKNIPVAIFGIR